MKHSGFSLAEVLIALFILSSSMFILSELQVKSMVRVWQSRQDIDRLYWVKKYLYKLYVAPKKAKPSVQTFEEPDVRIAIDPKGIHKKSSLAPLRNYLNFITSQGSWQDGDRERTLSIMSIVPYEPEDDA